jgi:hypothetical protein
MFSSVALELPKQDHARESNPKEWATPGNQSQDQPTLVGEILRGSPTRGVVCEGVHICCININLHAYIH